MPGFAGQRRIKRGRREELEPYENRHLSTGLGTPPMEIFPAPQSKVRILETESSMALASKEVGRKPDPSGTWSGRGCEEQVEAHRFMETNP